MELARLDSIVPDALAFGVTISAWAQLAAKYSDPKLRMMEVEGKGCNQEQSWVESTSVTNGASTSRSCNVVDSSPSAVVDTVDMVGPSNTIRLSILHLIATIIKNNINDNNNRTECGRAV